MGDRLGIHGAVDIFAKEKKQTELFLGPVERQNLLEILSQLSHSCSILLWPGRPGVVCLSEVVTQFRYRPTDGRPGSGQSWWRFTVFLLV